MTLQRFLIENYGPNVDAFKMALAEAIKFSRLNGISQITLGCVDTFSLKK